MMCKRHAPDQMWLEFEQINKADLFAEGGWKIEKH